MEQGILKLFMEKGFLLDKEMLNFLEELGDRNIANEIIEKIAVASQQKLITKNLVDKNISKLKPVLNELDENKKKVIEKYFVNVSVSVEVRKETEERAEEGEDEKERKEGEVGKEGGYKENGEGHRNFIKVLSSPVVVAQKLEVRDFVKHFRNRYMFLKKILQRRRELERLTAIDKISGNKRNFSVIGIVRDKSVTKNKNIILEIEDLTGRVKILINKSKEEIFEKGKEILVDDILGFKCGGSRDFLFCNDLFYPDSAVMKKNRTEDDVYALFTSDFHVGSNNFLEKNVNKFLDWLNGKNVNEEQKEILNKIRYMFVTGDSVDGVGIYPGQEKDLEIKDIRKQYEKLAEIYSKIPERINIIQCAGQHDAVRVAEPQPPIGKDFAEPLHKFKNLYLVSNPSLVEVGGNEEKRGIKVLMYHGASMHHVINEIEELRLSNAHSTPAKVVKHLLLRRHLAPCHGEVTYIPNKKEDPMLIKKVPDIITTGDLHKLDIDKYNGILIIANSCWQSQTAFEEKVGNQPDPCKIPLLNLKTGKLKIMDFSDDDLSNEESGGEDE